MAAMPHAREIGAEQGRGNFATEFYNFMSRLSPKQSTREQEATVQKTDRREKCLITKE